jgi:hypothetical protein
MPSRSLFQEQRAPSHASNGASLDQLKARSPNLEVQEIEMVEAISNKRHSFGESNRNPSKRPTITRSQQSPQ